METHADLIAGLPLYHLSQIFDDVRTLAEYRAGEIQLESLKLLPVRRCGAGPKSLASAILPFPLTKCSRPVKSPPTNYRQPASYRVCSTDSTTHRLAGNHPPSDCGRAWLSDTFPGSPDSNRGHRPAHGTGATGYPALPFLQGALPSFPDRHESGMD